MRLIDADSCEKYFYDHLDDNGMAGAMNAINEMPTINIDLTLLHNQALTCSVELLKLVAEIGRHNKEDEP